jgi:hypothetical protein
MKANISNGQIQQAWGMATKLDHRSDSNVVRQDCLGARIHKWQIANSIH